MNVTDRPGLQERYELATNTSDLTLTPHRTGPVDLLIAAGLSATELSAGLAHLRAQWPSAKPRKFTENQVAEHAATLPKRKGKPDLKRARTDYLAAYYVAIKRAAEGLHGRDEVMRQLLTWAAVKGIDGDLVGPALTWWVDSTCPVCDGRGARRLPDAPALGAACPHCNGSGLRPKPHDAERVLACIGHALGSARQGMRERL